jgi:hypothetical protein
MIEFVFETWLGRRPTVNPRVTYIALLHGRFARLSSLQGGRQRYWPLPTAGAENAAAQRRGVSCLTMTMN